MMTKTTSTSRRGLGQHPGGGRRDRCCGKLPGDQKSGQRPTERPKGFGKKGFGKAEGKGKWKRVHQEQVKLRTRCWKCGQIGHLSRECRSEPSASRTGQRAGSAAGSSNSTAKSGFFVASDAGAGGTPRQFWLKEFVESGKDQLGAPRGIQVRFVAFALQLNRELLIQQLKVDWLVQLHLVELKANSESMV